MTITAKSLAAVAITGLTSIVEAIKANPKAYIQGQFVQDFETESERGCVAFHHTKLTRTARVLKNLVAKHRVWMDNNDGVDGDLYKGNPFFEAARKDLKLTVDQANRLLGGTDKWPLKYMDMYENARTAKGRAAALAKRIQFFIDSDGTDLTARERKALGHTV